MYSTDSGAEFINYKIYTKDIRYVSIKEEYPEEFDQAVNDTIETLTTDGYKVVGITYNAGDVYFTAIVEYVSNDKIYYERGEEYGREQVQRRYRISKKTKGPKGQEE